MLSSQEEAEWFGAEDDDQDFPIIDVMTNREFKNFVSDNYPSDDEDARVKISLTDDDEYVLDYATVAKNHPFANDDDLVINPDSHVGLYEFDSETFDAEIPRSVKLGFGFGAGLALFQVAVVGSAIALGMMFKE